MDGCWCASCDLKDDTDTDYTIFFFSNVTFHTVIMEFDKEHFCAN